MFVHAVSMNFEIKEGKPVVFVLMLYLDKKNPDWERKRGKEHFDS